MISLKWKIMIQVYWDFLFDAKDGNGKLSTTNVSGQLFDFDGNNSKLSGNVIANIDEKTIHAGECGCSTETTMRQMNITPNII